MLLVFSFVSLSILKVYAKRTNRFIQLLHYYGNELNFYSALKQEIQKILFVESIRYAFAFKLYLESCWNHR